MIHFYNPEAVEPPKDDEYWDMRVDMERDRDE